MKTIFRKTIVLSFLFFYFLPLFSQVLSKKGFIKAVKEADVFYYYDQNYEKASELYESLLKMYPENSNLCAKLGICYLNLDGKKPEALKLILKASLNVVNDEKEYSEYGEQAPLDTYLYLAVAYHQIDSLDKAISQYIYAKKRMGETKKFQDEYIDNQIRDCRYALAIKKKPLTLISDLFAPWLSEYPGACNPVLSKNDSVFVFTQKQNGKTRILCSYKSGSWQRPEDITEQLGGFDRFYSNSITGDGKLLIIFLDDGGDGNLYYCQRKGNVWTKIKSVGRPINTIYWESHGFITPDGNTMYFASNRPGGEGELDIWYSEKKSNGKWDEPVNCGNTINTPYNENTPFFDPETGALLYSSNGLIGMGGYDVYRSVKKNGFWSDPIGMPYSFNSTLENIFFILNNNAPGFITSLYDEKTKSNNIYSIVAENPADKLISAIGTVSLRDGMNIDPKLLHLQLVDLKKSTPAVDIALSDSGSFKFEIKPGEYRLFVSQTGYKTDTVDLNIPLYFSGSSVSVNPSLIPDKVFGGDFLTINNILFDFDSYALTDASESSLEILKSILIQYPDLTVEVAGYADAIGGTEYNRRLADKRAQAVIDYFTRSGIQTTLFIKKAFGKSNFVALNNNPDGTDNPEGRKYNRRVTFGIVDPKTGVVIRKETYTPERLRQPNSLRYSIVLAQTNKKLYPKDFSLLTKNNLLFIKEIQTDSITMYVLSVFFNKTDAIKFLDYAKENGFENAYILNQYELDRVSEPDGNHVDKSVLNQDKQKIYTIQLKATLKSLDIDKVFKELKGISEIKTSGFYKYYYGEYRDLAKAREVLKSVKKLGYKDAFIKDI
jgi:outer membrane protein OmpA-like peptidoglycan-associated protein